MSTTVLEGSDDATLSRGAGHIEDTPFPGEAGNVGIAGHRDTVFRPLKKIQVGDPLELTTADRVYRYRISKTLIVGPNDVYVLDPTKAPTMTLVSATRSSKSGTRRGGSSAGGAGQEEARRRDRP